MKKNLLSILLGVVAGTVVVLNAFALDPANTTVTFRRSDPSETVTGGPFYKGATLLLTNCVLYADTTTNSPQNLTDCTVVAKVGSTTLAYVTATGTVQSAAAGTFYVSFSVPTNLDNSAILQVQITHTNGTSYIYNWKSIALRSSL
jgi:hypothetical protein